MWEPELWFPHLRVGTLMQGWDKPGKALGVLVPVRRVRSTLKAAGWISRVLTLHTGPPCFRLAVTLGKVVKGPFWESASHCPSHSESQKSLQVSSQSLTVPC